jgi:hypothetical protein
MKGNNREEAPKGDTLALYMHTPLTLLNPPSALYGPEAPYHKCHRWLIYGGVALALNQSHINICHRQHHTRQA